MKHKANQNECITAWQVNQVRIEFTDKVVTSWGGICTLVAKFLEQIEFKKWVEETIPVEERSPNARGVYPKVLAQLLTCLTGGSRFNHLQWWGHGIEALRECFGEKWLPQASSVLTRFWGKIKYQSQADQVRRGANGLARTLVEQDGIKEDNLIMDSSVCCRYGKQEGAKRGYNPQKPGRPSHHPLKAALGSGYVMNIWNRSGDVQSAHGCVEFYKGTRRELPSSLRINWVLLDSGFYKIELIEHLEVEQQKYIIAVPISQTLQRRIMSIEKWKTIAPGIEVAEFEFEHQDKKWTKPRRYIVVRQCLRTRPQASGKQPMLFKELEEHRDYRYSLYLTNDKETLAEEIWRTYRPRAKEENVIKDLKEGYGWDTFNMRGFWATETVMVMIASVFHNLIMYLNRKVLRVGESIHQLKTMRSKYFAWPAILGLAGRTSVLRLGIKDRKLQRRIRDWLGKIAALPLKLLGEQCSANCIAVGAYGSQEVK